MIGETHGTRTGEPLCHGRVDGLHGRTVRGHAPIFGTSKNG